ncbi:MAG: hypothetical protein H6682_10715 [Candidatus Eisenbacteria bacterium]|nr:hypothetical protein [Candidatus Eisenbacteria bacterium]
MKLDESTQIRYDETNGLGYAARSTNLDSSGAQSRLRQRSRTGSCNRRSMPTPGFLWAAWVALAVTALLFHSSVAISGSGTRATAGRQAGLGHRGTIGTTDETSSGRMVARETSPELQFLSPLQVQLLGKEFEQWGNEKVVYDPESVLLRWTPTTPVRSGTWQLASTPFPSSNVLATGTVDVPRADGTSWTLFRVPLGEGLPTTPPPSGSSTYYLRVVPAGSQGASSQVVRIVYKKDESSTRFTAAGLHPELFSPMPVFVDLNTFELIRADEEDDEEPCIVPLVIFMDGTTVDVLDLSHSTVRVATPKRKALHGNIPQYNGSIGSGDSITIPDDVGLFESEILPINIELADDPLLEALFGFRIDYSQLTNATMVWVLVLAMEEDATSDEAAEAARDAFVQGLRSELNNCIQSMELADAIQLIRNGQNLDAVLTADDSEICGYVATEDSSVLDQIRSKLTQMAKDAGTGEELDEAIYWLPGGITNLLDDAADADDVIGFAYRSFSYDQLWRADRPISFTLDMHLNEGPEFPRAGRREVHYQVKGRVGRCQHVPGKDRCVPVVEGSWAYGQ